MKLSKNLIDDVVLDEIGKRLTQRRLELNMTQAELAHAAGISKRTLERIESGESTQLSNFIRIIRSLDLLDRIDAFLPEARPGPIELLKRRGKERKRAYSKRKQNGPEKEWSWEDKE